MNQLKEIIKKIHSTKPQWSIDVYDLQYESKIKCKYQLTDILNESDSVENWFDELSSKEIQILTFKKNGTSWKKEGLALNINLDQIEETVNNHSDFTGLNAPQLIANTTLLADLRKKYQQLNAKYESDTEALKAKFKKKQKKYEKVRDKLFRSEIQAANKPFFDNETKTELAKGLSGFLGGFVGKAESTGLNAPDEKLSELQTSFIQFIKQLDDVSITKLGELYNNEIDQTNTTTQVAQS